MFWRYITISVGSEDLAADSPTFNSLPISMQTIWTPFEAVNPLSGFGSHPSGDMKTQCRGSLSPTFPESIEPPFAWRIRSDPPDTVNYVGLVPIYTPAFSKGTDTNSYPSSNGGGSISSSPL